MKRDLLTLSLLFATGFGLAWLTYELTPPEPVTVQARTLAVATPKCGIERWTVKTMPPTAGDSLPASVHDLRALAAPSRAAMAHAP